VAREAHEAAVTDDVPSWQENRATSRLLTVNRVGAARSVAGKLMVLLLRAVTLVLVAACAQPSSSPAGAEDHWEVGEYRETLLRSEVPIVRGGALRIEQTEVIRPKLTPDGRALLVARYSVSSATPINVKETREVRYGDRVVLTRETVVKRSSGEWRSEYLLPVPANASEGAYTLTTRVELMDVGLRSVPEERVAMFTVEPGKRPSPVDTGKPSPPRIRLWTDRTRYKIGDSVVFNFETTADGYVTLVNVATSGACNILFPNRFSDGYAVKAKTRYTVPHARDSYDLRISGPPGIDLVYAVLTVEPMKFVEGDTSRACDFRPLTRSINAVLRQTPQDKQDRAALEVEIVP